MVIISWRSLAAAAAAAAASSVNCSRVVAQAVGGCCMMAQAIGADCLQNEASCSGSATSLFKRLVPVILPMLQGDCPSQ
jgi:hypothetical protein